VIDDTFSHRFLRDRFRKVAESVGVPFLLLFVDTPLAVIEARIADNARTGARAHIAADVFAHHRDRFQFPDADESPVRLVSDADLDRWLTAQGGDSWSELRSRFLDGTRRKANAIWRLLRADEHTRRGRVHDDDMICEHAGSLDLLCTLRPALLASRLAITGGVFA